MTTNLPVLWKPPETEPPEMVRVTAAAHPLRAERTFRFVPAGSTVREIVEDICPLEYREHVYVSVNGGYVSEPNWDSIRVNSEDIIVLRAIPQGGAGKLFKTLLTLAVVAIAFTFAAPLAGLLFTGGSLLGSVGLATGLAGLAISTVGNLLINALIPPSQLANANSSSGGLPQYTFGVQGISNEERPYSTVPRCYGRTLFTPPKGAHSYTVISNNFQYLYALFDLGPGPINISEIKIGTSPITDFADVQYETREGRDSDDPITLYNNAVHQTPLSIGLLHQNDTGTQQTPAGVSNIAVDITAPGGLFQTNGSGGLQQEEVDFRLTITDAVSGATVFDKAINLFGTSNASVGNTYVVGVAEGSVGDALPVGQYNVTLTRTSGEPDVNKGVSGCYWTNIRSWGPATGPLLPQNHAKIAVVIRATEQLNGDLTSLNVIAQSYVQVWDGTEFTEQLNTHPAWAALDILTGSSNARALTTDRVDLASLLEWSEVYPTAEFNYIFSSRTTVWQALKTVGSAGRGIPVIRDGLYGYVFDRTQDNPVQMFTPRNVKDFKVVHTFLDEVDGMEVRYVSETLGWQQNSIYIYADGVTEDTANFNFVSTLDLVGVTSDDWAWKLGSYFFAASILRNNNYTFTTDLDHLACNPGDRVLVQHDVTQSGIGSGRVIGITRDGLGHVTGFQIDNILMGDGTSSYMFTLRTTTGGLYSLAVNTISGETDSYTLTISHDDSSDYFQIGDLVSIYTTTTLLLDAIVKTISPQSEFLAQVTLLDYAPSIHSGDAIVPPPVTNDRINKFLSALPVSSIVITNLTAEEDDSLIATGGSAIPRIHGSFMTNMDGIPPVLYEVQYKVSTDTGWLTTPNLPSNAMDFYIQISNTTIGLTYDVRIRGTNATVTNPGPWTQADLTITDYLVPPPAPTSLTITPVITGVTATITAATGRTPSKYRLYIGALLDAFAQADIAAEGTTNILSVSGLDAKTVYNFWATTFNDFGTESAPVGPVTGLPLPVGYDGLQDDVTTYLDFLGQTTRDHNDAIEQISQAVASIGLGNKVDFDLITDGYTNAINEVNTNIEQTVADVTTLQAAMNGYLGANAIASLSNTLQTQITTNAGDISINTTDITGLQSALNGYTGANAVSTAVTTLQTQVTTNAGNISTQSTAITNLQSTLTGYSSSSTVASAVSGLQTQITTNAGNISTTSSAVTTLQSALNGYTGANAVSTSISSLQTQISTNGSNISIQSTQISSLQSALSGYTGGSAVSNAVSSLQTQITTADGNISANASSISAVDAQVGNFYASGLFRTYVAATNAGAQATVGISVAVSGGGGTYGAGIYLDALSSGVSRCTIIASQFYITDGSSFDTPFFFSGGAAYLQSAYIQNISANNITTGVLNVGLINAGAINTPLLAGNAVTTSAVSAAGATNGVSLTWVNINSITVAVTGGVVLLSFTDYIQWSSNGPRGYYRLVDNYGTLITQVGYGGGSCPDFIIMAGSGLDTSGNSGTLTWHLQAYWSAGNVPTHTAPYLIVTELKR